MYYDDGIELNEDGRVLKCPRCDNEEFSNQSEFCRICGSQVFNHCEGEWNDEYQDYVHHKNPGNARYCETCGKQTYFFQEGFLKGWQEVQNTLEDDLPPTPPELEEDIPDEVLAGDVNDLNDLFESDELPF